MLTPEITQLRNAEDKFKVLMETAPSSMIIANLKGKIILVNGQSEKLFRYTKEELAGKPIEKLLPAYFFINQAYNKAHYEKAPEALAKGEGLELFGITKDGMQIPVDVNLSQVVANEESLIFASVRDITEQKKAVEELRKTQKDFQLLVSSVKDYAIFMLDVNGNIITWNSGAEKINGYREEEIIGKNIEVFYAREDIEKGEPKSNLQKALNEGRFESEGLRVRKDGSMFYANVVFTPRYDDNQNLYGYAKVTCNITEKRKTVEDLRYMATIAKNIQDPVISYDNDALITRWNDAAEKLLGWKSEEVMGKNIDSVLNVYYPNETRAEILITLQKNGYWKGELVYYTKARQPVYVLAALLQLKDCDGIITGIMVIAQNITERKKSEEAIIKFNYELEQRVKERTEYIYKSEIRFRTLIENSNDIFLMLDDNFKTIYCSPSSGRLTGWDDKEVINEDMLINVHPDDRDLVKDLLNMAIIHPGKIFNLLFRNQHKNERYLWLEGTVINLLSSKYIKALIVNLHDETARKETEDKLVKTLRRIADDKHSLY